MGGGLSTPAEREMFKGCVCSFPELLRLWNLWSEFDYRFWARNRAPPHNYLLELVFYNSPGGSRFGLWMRG